MFALGIEFLTGTAVMTAADSREMAEWPPHPARVFMALVAAHHETRPLPEDGAEARASWAEERDCLEWLEKQDPPAMHCVQVPYEHRRAIVKFYVPVNDTRLTGIAANVKSDGIRDALGVMPAFRNKQERTFPAVSLGIDAQRNQVHLIWQDSELPTELRAAFQRLAAKVIRIGHSSSLTTVWIAGEASLPTATLSPTASTKGVRYGVKLRSIASGLLANLEERFNADEINTFFELKEKIEGAKGEAKTKAKADFKARFHEDWTSSLTAPVRRRPFIGVGHAYAELGKADEPIVSSVFDSEILVLTKLDGRVLGLESTNLLIEALRGTLLSGSEGKPDWFTGHRTSGEPADGPHLALFPLGFVGRDHADGHVLGMALAFPKTIDAKERAEQLRSVLFNSDGSDRELTLNLGKHGNWTLLREDRPAPPTSLNTNTWTSPSTVWASVTPVVLDRHPKHDLSKPQEREAWRNEVVDSISASCTNIGLPTPISVDIDKTSWHRGAPRSKPGPNGMPWLTSKNNTVRQQVHVLIQFDCEVEGPVLIGAGRYRGYGLCKPLGYPTK